MWTRNTLYSKDMESQNVMDKAYFNAGVSSSDLKLVGQRGERTHLVVFISSQLWCLVLFQARFTTQRQDFISHWLLLPGKASITTFSLVYQICQIIISMFHNLRFVNQMRFSRLQLRSEVCMHGHERHADISDFFEPGQNYTHRDQ